MRNNIYVGIFFGLCKLMYFYCKEVDFRLDISA